MTNEVLNWIRNIPNNSIIVGDLNYPEIDWSTLHSTNPLGQEFLDTANDKFLSQHVDFPTHRDGHTLDIVVCFDGDISLSSFTANRNDISDHFLVTFDMQFFPNAKKKK